MYVASVQGLSIPKIELIYNFQFIIFDFFKFTPDK